MKRFGRSVLSVFFLLVFLYPLAEKTLHELSHAGDVHCNTVSQYHLHQEEHHCEVCDFTLTGTAEFSAIPLQCLCVVASTIGIPPLTTSVLVEPPYFFQLRAPPLA
ncbi:MAG TPA: hypothetical protein PLI08_03310 [Bacteroidia bacterium]|jgi:hypothetical protein|nr:hypothetical protein [Bacteroidia bacterium]MBP7728589.1 hypothetical protein [Bacteroidia bacterium]HPD52946.1 hypothetical protein [Bacteroidia bacterium]HRS39699.1 hypothetical protein [Bacteroidia bacterium]HRU61725.1 hypothetical protein [Bacteroidia bacterium]